MYKILLFGSKQPSTYIRTMLTQARIYVLSVMNEHEPNDAKNKFWTKRWATTENHCAKWLIRASHLHIYFIFSETGFEKRKLDQYSITFALCKEEKKTIFFWQLFLLRNE